MPKLTLLPSVIFFTFIKLQTHAIVCSFQAFKMFYFFKSRNIVKRKVEKRYAVKVCDATEAECRLEDHLKKKYNYIFDGIAT